MRKNSKPLVLNDSLVTCGSLDSTYPIQVGSQAWSDWLTQNDGFTYKGNIGHFTARSELRRGIRYWYGYRRREGKLTKTYLGKPEELTLKRLEQASAILAGQVILGWLSNLPDTANMPPIEVLAEMSNLSLTKFKPPALSQKLITRPRLTQRINAPVTLISAPNGFGKTTLINEWRQTCGMPVAWVTLDSNDNHPQRFWASVVMALRTIDPQFGQGWISERHLIRLSTL
jgi:LuxR family maltose regulon positive regulatory protein